MLNLVHLAQGIFANETARLRRWLFRLATALLLLAIAAGIVLIGLVYLFAGLYQSLLPFMPAWQAGAIISVTTLLIAALLVFWASRQVTHRGAGSSGRLPVSVSDELSKATECGIAAGERLKCGLRPIDLVLSAFITGLVVSRSGIGSGRCKPDQDRRP